MIERVTRGSADPDVILVDHRLPGISCKETAKEVTKLIPGIRIIITTAGDSIKPEARASGFSFIQKPFSLATLVKTIDGSH